ncbi:MAG: hypothetical protein A3I32_02765 [Candidatus Yanofskybacteria bacterium RIFCSPLOWO2_02_FULL_45_10]|uniref:HNH nuclease domain-containing protein n=2 Tax=Candidatus Yanofskyibacteriota TaxID=1752733 RepID=A0A1F8G0P7_9BACT|nr:MAG: hypothetical protein A3F25_02790 [Candidatus Yanofskybacteria bacterium RIFCSPHIGHO2_12_FULL_45_19b]OGN31574.1 MAG: hypothetical protein A3I32_02765 [Candidatus Yanofskybacteria bacterium RIFCSPLOWO2_02_FULL_45_10]
MLKVQQLRKSCLNCGNLPARSAYKYCSIKCQQAYQFRDYIQKWKIGKLSGLSKQGLVSPQIKRYLREKHNNQCCLCGWTKVNPITKKVPLVADHIDGNWRNNLESNLQLVCPNCDSLSPTYKGGGKNIRQGR